MTTKRLRRSLAAVAVCAVMVGAVDLARADNWMITVEAPGAMAVRAPQRHWFGVGVMPSAAVYRAITGKLLLGVRLRAGFLSDGPAPSNPMVVDPKTGGLGSATVGVRLAGDGPWLEVGSGVAVTGDHVRPTAELGVGWTMDVLGVRGGPMARYVYVHRANDMFNDHAAHLALAGFELRFGGDARRTALRKLVVRRPIKVRRPVQPVKAGDRDHDRIIDAKDRCPDEPEDRDGFEDDDGCPDLDNDGDTIVDTADSCPDEKEVVNGADDDDGCPDKLVEVVGQRRTRLRVVLLFDFNRARVKWKPQRQLEALIRLWKRNPGWQRLVVEAHADERGSNGHNQWLSNLRATNVRRKLIQFGFPRGKIDIRGLGKSRPRSRGRQSLNRRAEFFVVVPVKTTKAVRTDRLTVSKRVN